MVVKSNSDLLFTQYVIYIRDRNNYQINTEKPHLIDAYVKYSSSQRCNYTLINIGKYSSAKGKGVYPVGYSIATKYGWKGRILFEKDHYVYYYENEQGYEFSSLSSLRFPHVNHYSKAKPTTAQVWGMQSPDIAAQLAKEEFIPDDPCSFQNLYIVNSNMYKPNIQVHFRQSSRIPYEPMIQFLSYYSKIELSETPQKILVYNKKAAIGHIDIIVEEEQASFGLTLKKIPDDIVLERKCGYSIIKYDLDIITCETISKGARYLLGKCIGFFGDQKQILLRIQYMTSVTVDKYLHKSESIDSAIEKMLMYGDLRCTYFPSGETIKNSLIKDKKTIKAFI